MRQTFNCVQYKKIKIKGQIRLPGFCLSTQESGLQYQLLHSNRLVSCFKKIVVSHNVNRAQTLPCKSYLSPFGNSSLSLSHCLYSQRYLLFLSLSLFSKKMSIGISGTSGGKNYSKIFFFHFSLWCSSHCQWIRQFAGGFESIFRLVPQKKMTENIVFKRDSYFFFPYFSATKQSYFSFRFSIIVKSQLKCFCLFEDSWRIGWNY